MSNYKLLESLIYQGARDKNLELSDNILDRLQYELYIIKDKGFENHFILYSKIIEVCNNLKLVRSAGRGTAPSSLVNYCLDITCINPLDFDFRFEKFIHPNQIFLPDIDIDIPTGYSDKIIIEFKQRFPEYYIYPILYNPKNEVGEDFDIVIGSKSYKIHPTGYIITHNPISESLVEIENKVYYVCDDHIQDPILNYKVDLVELDCLNHLMPFAASTGICPVEISLDDKKVFEIFKTGQTENIFGFESAEIQNILREFQPNSINNLALIFALNRPPFNKWLPNIIKNKLENKIPTLQTSDQVNMILSESCGVVVYHEQFLDILIDVSGMKYTEAYYWFKKLQNENTKENQTLFNIEFSNKCFENTELTKPEIAILVCLLLDTCQWTFQKTHALSYAMLSYWSAYYKTHFLEVINGDI